MAKQTRMIDPWGFKESGDFVSLNVQFNNKLAENDAANASQDKAIASMGEVNAEQDAKIAATESTDALQSERIEAAETLNAEQTEKIEMAEAINELQDEEINNLFKMVNELNAKVKNLESVNGVIDAATKDDVDNASEGSNIVVTSDEAMAAMTSNKVFDTVTVIGANCSSDSKAIATNGVTMVDVSVNGGKGASNGRVQLSASTVNLDGVTIESGSTAYNVFESSQNVNAPQYFTKSYNVKDCICDNTELNHNIFNVYTLADNAVITIKDSFFSLDPTKSNVLRLSNYTNATGVTVNFENVSWTYEESSSSDFSWAGLVIYQPASSDAALNGDTSSISTWKFNFKQCSYNGDVVTSNSFGGHAQVVYLYNVGKSGAITNPEGVLDLSFE